jgi:hypothetical protein
MDPDE